MIICVLILYPASRLDWLVLGRLAAGTISNMPGNPYLQHHRLLWLIDHFAVRMLAPTVMLAATVALVALCLSGRWNQGCSQAGAPGPEDAGRPAPVADPFPERAASGQPSGSAIWRSHLAAAVPAGHPAWPSGGQAGQPFGPLASGV